MRAASSRRLALPAVLLAGFLAVLLPSGQVAASGGDTAYRPYTYDEWRQAVPSPSGYEATRIVFGEEMGVGPLRSPADFFVLENGDLAILDSGNNRIILADAGYRVRKVLADISQDGAPSPLNNPQGLFVDRDGTILVADTSNSRVVVLDPEGRILQEFRKPASELYPQKEEFRPQKVLRDPSGITYVICTGIYSGAVMYSPQGEFLGFFGSNRVEVTFRLLADRFWKSIFSDENRNKLANYIPVEYSSFDLDAEGFIYSVTASSNDPVNRVRKLNSLGLNILETHAGNSFQGGFGDMNPYVYNRMLVSTRLSDIDASRDGFLFCLDSTRGRVFQYDAEANLMFVFGGIGNQLGLFMNPTAVESVGDRVLVLDRNTGAMTEFRRTEFGQAVREAITLYNDGYHRESVEPWRQVLAMDSNYNIAYVGLGKAAFEAGRYGEALRNFRIAAYVSGYSQAFKERRKEVFRETFTWLVLGLAGVALLLLGLGVLRRRLAVSGLGARMEAHPAGRLALRARRDLREAAAIPLHPIDGFTDLFDRKRQSLPAAGVLLLLFFVALVVHRQLTGFIFNSQTRLDQLNILAFLAQSFGLAIAFAAVNWAVTTLFDGKGRFRDILVVVAYSLQPYVAALLAGTLLSNLLARDEAVFLTYLLVLGQAWSAFLLVKGLEAVHQYNIPQTLSAILATVFGILVLIILLILSLSLVQQIVGFFTTVYQEYAIRFR